MMNVTGGRVYECAQCGSALGMIVKLDKRSKLNVFRLAVPLGAEKVDSDYSVVGLEAGSVVCSWCGATRVWRISEQAITDLLDGMKRRREVEI